MPTLTTQAHSIHYHDRGEGTPILLFHAFPLNADMWEPQLSGLSEKARILAPDARGFGKSRPTPDALTMDIIADDGRALLDSLGIGKAVVGGVSMGGYAALAFWCRHRAQVAGLILADTRPTADSEEGRAGRHAFAKNALKHGSSWVADEMARKLQRLKPDPAVEATLRSMIEGASPKAVAAAQRGMSVRSDCTAALGDIQVPVLVMVGEQDSLVPVVRAKKMADACPNSKLVELADAGHVANLEQPEAFNREVLEFLGSLP